MRDVPVLEPDDLGDARLDSDGLVEDDPREEAYEERREQEGAEHGRAQDELRRREQAEHVVRVW